MNYPVLFAVLMGCNIGFNFMNIPAVLDRLLPVYGTSYTGISVLMSALVWSHAAMQVPSGLIADRLGMRPALFLSIACILLGNVGAALSPRIEFAVLARAFTGVGTGLVFITSMKLATVHAPEGRTGMYQALMGGFFSFGNIADFLVLPIAVRGGWYWAFLLPALVCVPFLIAAGKLRIREEPALRGPVPSLSRVIRVREGWTLGLYHALSWGTMLTLGNWIPSLLADVWKAPATMGFAWGGILVLLISGLGRSLGGLFTLRVGPAVILRGSILILSFLFFGIFFTASPQVILCLALLAAWFASVNFGSIFYLAAKAAPAGSLASLTGLISLLGNLGAILFTLMFGAFKDMTGSFVGGFLVLAVLALASLGADGVLPGKLRKNLIP